MTLKLKLFELNLAREPLKQYITLASAVRNTYVLSACPEGIYDTSARVLYLCLFTLVF